VAEKVVRPWPDRRLRPYVGSGGRPTDSSTWRSMARCAGMLSGNLATRPNMALRPLVIRSDTGARPVRKQTSELRTKSCHLILSIQQQQKTKSRGCTALHRRDCTRLYHDHHKRCQYLSTTVMDAAIRQQRDAGSQPYTSSALTSSARPVVQRSETHSGRSGRET